ncbi:phage portal protein [Streptomyces acidiscabies]|uniref:Phage portal protein n=1 Tax=Streptomyces acidiscabies TaxID=42234 RepID=A0ABU4M840_9ACTN|nr:phage portal protein [Streptomyces acidiscabies]MDX3024063.1 phage portal protein [Streptomyces acidiscabies]
MSVWWRGRTRTAPGQGERRSGELSLDQVMAMMKTSRSYADVDLSRAESALQAVAVWSACDLIAGVVSELPVDCWRGKGSEAKEFSVPWWLEDPDGSGHGLSDWRYQALMSWLLRGNLFGDELQRASGGYLQQVRLFHPDEVSGWLENGREQWAVNGTQIPGQQFLHRRVNPVPGVVLGMSPVRLHATTIGLQLTGAKFGLQWFQDGAHPSAILKNTEVTLDDDQVRTAKDRFMAALRGSREPVVFGKGWEYQTIQVAPEESQFLQTQGYTAAECARIFGPGIAEILGYETGGSMTYANIQDRELTLLKYALGKWIRRTERVLSEFLPRPQYVKLNRDALLETNTLQRYQAHAAALGANWETINEVRRLEDKPPVPWGDAPFTPAASAAEPSEPAQEE